MLKHTRGDKGKFSTKVGSPLRSYKQNGLEWKSSKIGVNFQAIIKKNVSTKFEKILTKERLDTFTFILHLPR